MIPLIAQTSRLTLIAASRALLTAELHKPHYFPVLLGSALPAVWPPVVTGPDSRPQQLALLTEGGRTAAGWYSWYALRKAHDGTPRTLIGVGGFLGPPDAAGTVEIDYSVADEWRGQGLATELVAGLVQQAAATGMVRRLLARPAADNPGAQQVLRRNGFAETATLPDGRLSFEREVEPAG
ncbi:hypothetical protein GCM10023185_12850 [Hymenobacter saemangeumensis]|uniref:N-acetyltransferase domain-containing protein n=1 Tax=Hymenobacter saemangeumensis TaxID=1084522 RepID=A0ABP8I7G4_9BACT